LPQQCDGSFVETRWLSGVSVSGFSTTILFGQSRVDLAEQSVVGSLGYHANPRWGITGALGAVLDGSATTAASHGDVGAGVVGSLTGSWLPLYEGPRRPFLLLSLSLGASRTTAVSDDGQRHPLTAGDARVAALVGKSFGPVVPFLAARAFGGPVSWRLAGAPVAGGDAHHYAVGAGFSLRLPARLELFAEAMPLGERSATGGLSFRY
jgi:hypothetical protein